MNSCDLTRLNMRCGHAVPEISRLSESICCPRPGIRYPSFHDAVLKHHRIGKHKRLWCTSTRLLDCIREASCADHDRMLLGVNPSLPCRPKHLRPCCAWRLIRYAIWNRFWKHAYPAPRPPRKSNLSG